VEGLTSWMNLCRLFYKPRTLRYSTSVKGYQETHRTIWKSALEKSAEGNYQPRVELDIRVMATRFSENEDIRELFRLYMKFYMQTSKPNHLRNPAP